MVSFYIQKHTDKFGFVGMIKIHFVGRDVYDTPKDTAEYRHVASVVPYTLNLSECNFLRDGKPVPYADNLNGVCRGTYYVPVKTVLN